MRHILLVAISTLLLTAEVSAAGPRSYDCLVTDFFHDDRYPMSDDLADRHRAMSISILDAEDEVVVYTQLPGDSVESQSIEVTERTGDKVVANWQHEDYYRNALTLQPPENLDTAEAVMGTLVYRSYETNHTWELRCANVAIGSERPTSDGRQ